MNHKKIPAMLLETERLEVVSTMAPFDKAKAGFYIMEVFKDISGYEGIYQISNYGRLKSFAQNQLGKIIIGTTTTYGYSHISLYKNKQEIKYYVHRLVATTFISNPENKPQINHKNSNKKDNNVENLEWNTSGENLKHSYLMGTHDQKRFKNGNAKLDGFQVRVIRECVDLDSVELARIFNISRSSIYRIKAKDNQKCKAEVNGKAKIIELIN